MKNNSRSNEYDNYLNRNNNTSSQNFSTIEPKPTEFSEEEDHFQRFCSRNLICDICGCSGHRSKDCKEIPSINDLELLIKSDIDYAEMKIKIDSEKKKKEMNDQNKVIDIDIMNSRIYAEDYFGLYVVDGGENDPIKIDGSLDNDLYCINCGKKGHVFSKCNRPDLSQILDYSGNTNYNSSPKIDEGKFYHIWNNQK